MGSSIYKKVMDYLLDIISRNANIPNYKLPSERMLTVTFDASRKPVRHAYNELIKLGYVTNIHGRGYLIRSDIPTDKLQTAFRKDMRISLVIPSIVTQYSHSILSGVSDFCTNNHIALAIHISDNAPEKEAALIRSVSQSSSMGIILFPSDSDFSSHSELMKLVVRKYPLVLVDRSRPNVHASFVSSDDHQAMVDAVKFLYEKNYQNPLFVTPPASLASSVDSRINGYTHGLLKYYKMATPRNLLNLVGSENEQTNTMVRYLQDYPNTDVIILQGVQRYPVLNAIQKLGTQSIKLMLFDDELTHTERDILKPYFILQDGYHIGYYAAETLCNHIWGDMRPVIKRFPVTIIDDAEDNSNLQSVSVPNAAESV